MPLPSRAEVRQPVALPVQHASSDFDPFQYSAIPGRAARIYLQLVGWGLAPEREDNYLLGRRISLVPGARPSVEQSFDLESPIRPQTVVLADPYGTQVQELRPEWVYVPPGDDGLG